MIKLWVWGVEVRLSVLFFAGAALLLTLDRSGTAAWGLAAARWERVLQCRGRVFRLRLG